MPSLDEECVKQGIEFIPTRLTQKRPRNTEEEGSRGNPSKHSSSTWEPSSSDDGHSDSEDSMSDLYPRQYLPSTHIRFIWPLISGEAHCPSEEPILVRIIVEFYMTGSPLNPHIMAQISETLVAGLFYCSVTPCICPQPPYSLWKTK